MEEPNNDIDTETLQAQIDLSMAYAQNLVASWLPPPSSSSALTQSSSRAAEAEAELQALLRRPPRCVFFFPFVSSPALESSRGDIYSSCFWAIHLGWALARRSPKLLLLRRRVSCRNSKVERGAHGP